MKEETKNLLESLDNPRGKYNGNEARYVLEALDSENKKNEEYPWARRLEEAFTAKYNVQFAIAHNSGTSTLHSCLAAAGVGVGDEVISPAYTVISLAFATLHQNAIPVFADSDPKTFNIDPNDIERKITPKTKAIFAVHMHGLPCDMDSIMDIAKRHNLIVIEDCAQSINVKYKGRYVGTIGHMASFSFEVKKHISTGQGGMVITNDCSLATGVRKMAGLGYRILTPKAGMHSLLPKDFQNPNYVRHDALGWNYRMPEVCAAIGLAQFERVEQLVARRQKVAAIFLDAISGCGWLVPQVTPPRCENAFWTLAIQYNGQETIGLSWEQFYELHVRNGGHGFYGALCLQPFEGVMEKKPFMETYLNIPDPSYQKRFRYHRGDYPVAEYIQPRIMQFKTNFRDLTEASEQAKILKDSIRKASESSLVLRQ